jgi:hypothetical protein
MTILNLLRAANLAKDPYIRCILTDKAAQLAVIDPHRSEAKNTPADIDVLFESRLSPIARLTFGKLNTLTMIVKIFVDKTLTRS